MPPAPEDLNHTQEMQNVQLLAGTPYNRGSFFYNVLATAGLLAEWAGFL